MNEFLWRVGIYFGSFLLCMYSLNALDFNRFLKQGKVLQAQVLYLILSCSLAYLFGSFLIAIIYRLH